MQEMFARTTQPTAKSSRTLLIQKQDGVFRFCYLSPNGPVPADDIPESLRLALSVPVQGPQQLASENRLGLSDLATAPVCY